MIEFNPPGYRRLLQHIQNNGYCFAQFRDLTDVQSGETKKCFMRHDVDVSLDFALQMAELEHSMDVRVTYFVMFRSPIYNLLSRHNSFVLESIQRLGHQICLHFDAGGVRETQFPIARWIEFELGALEFLTGEKITAFSLHQPSQATIDQRIELPGVVNTYHPEHLRGIRYLSDSNRDWRGKDPVREIESGQDSLQILTHPLWWMCRDSIDDCWDAAICANFANAQRQLLATERAYGMARKMVLVRNDDHNGFEGSVAKMAEDTASRDDPQR